ncbi:T9SS type B sorting domain-containing protein [Winogradskyella sp. DF17]|uniref:T9SS type B sorting domain-containing protein n=1 Tax=Winogradskyella pelagia TaxID=2819984 RepID=A0ABS3T0E0_9FLAO|nr:T9SS type B sorting domain-containing protein [Winogradskyella sp. DF17]MBO3116207.1 T9SS type B sorting domain-containing protein [Winogradskyella sp. DF17]
MKKSLFLISFLATFVSWSQNVQVDAQLYSPQELIEDVLIGSDCIYDVVVTNVVGGNFNGTDESYGYFDASGSNFPLANGIVLSTGRLQNVEGPNDSLSDDDAPGWVGDDDLERILNESQTINATILEFDFTSAEASQISFRFLFASEEYQEGNNNTCRFSDLFGFLIRQANEQEYDNIALIPDTTTPIKVTTVHSGIPGSGGCAPINEDYFGSWNGINAPINFNGQTKVLRAVADIIPNVRYHVKLVIADHINYRYDSAVFLEAGSFRLSADLGPNRLNANNNALCENETLTLTSSVPGTGNGTYTWFRDGVQLIDETNPTLDVSTPGTYSLELFNGINCTFFGEVVIEYSSNPIVANTTLINCDVDLDGYSTYDLYDATNAITSGDSLLNVVDFFELFIDANQNNNPITNPNSYNNTSILQTVYARVENSNSCYSIAEVVLDVANNQVVLDDYEICDENNDGYAIFNATDIENFIQSQNTIPAESGIALYSSQDDMINQTNPIIGMFENNMPNEETLYVQITNNGNCYAYSNIDLVVNPTPQLEPDENLYYCLNSFPSTILLDAGVTNGNSNNFSYEWFRNGTNLNINNSQISVNEIGNYMVTVTHPQGCSHSRLIYVDASNEATITNIIVQEASNNNSITVEVNGEGNYEYALDNGVYQGSNTFSFLSPGFYSVYVRDKNGCGIIQDETAILGFPKFFTPNGDGNNDTWHIIGVDTQIDQVESVHIYNRYGKLLKVLNGDTAGWDGTFIGAKMPSNDYWYLANIKRGNETFQLTGHFSLKR